MDNLQTRNSNRQQVKDQLTLRKSKLENKRRHIKNLVAKKERLEIEIKGALRSLKKAIRQDRKGLTESLGLDPEATDDQLMSAISVLRTQDDEVREVTDEIDQLAHELIFLAKPSEILTTEDVTFLKNF